MEKNNMLFEIDGISVEIIRKKIKNMYLRIYPPDGQVKITAPLKLPLKTIHNHLATKQDFIRAARSRYLSQPKPAIQCMENGEQHFYLGKPYFLMVHENLSPRQPAQIRIDDTIMHCYIEPGTTSEQRMMVLQTWYAQQMRALLPDLIKKWEPIIGVQVFECKIKSMKTRWGSCNVVTHRIWLNLSLIQKPLACLESVLVHEMTHLHEANHSKRFYALMDQFMPDWRIHKP